MTARVAAIVLAAGLGRRFSANGAATKAVASLDGVPLVRIVAMAALRSRAVDVTVVTGHARAEVEAALHGLDLRLAHNADFATGMAGSLQAGAAALDEEIDGMLVMLADMPFVRVGTLDALIGRYEERCGEIDAVAPAFQGRRGNPVLVGRSLFDGLRTLRGDEGARGLLSQPLVRLDWCGVDDPGVLLDLDTQADVDAHASGATQRT